MRTIRYRSAITSISGSEIRIGKLKNYIGACAFFAAAALPFAAAEAETQLDQVGTLACTSEPAKAAAAADVRLSCSFDASEGTGAHYAGSILRKGKSDIPEGKRVFMWSVFANKKQLASEDLVGRYVGAAGAATGQHLGELKGGKSGSILLRSPVSTSQMGDGQALTVLQLDLQPAKA